MMQAHSSYCSNASAELHVPAAGRRHKPDKWTALLNAKREEHKLLLKTVKGLEAEQSVLRAKEQVLVQVVEGMAAVVLDAADNQDSSHQASVSAPPKTASLALPSSNAGAAAVAYKDMLKPPCPASAVQQYEQEILRLCASGLRSLCTQGGSQSTRDMVKQLCTPHFAQQVQTLSAQQLASRLSSLAGSCAIHILQQQQQPSVEAAGQENSSPLHQSVMEFIGLNLCCMMWEHTKFWHIINTNLDVQELFEEPLHLRHWLKVLQRLQLSEQQLSVLSCLYDKFYMPSKLTILRGLKKNLQQQVANTAELQVRLQAQQQLARQLLLGQEHARQQQEQQQQQGQQVMSNVYGSAGQHLRNQTALMQQQSTLIRQQVLPALHTAMVAVSTLNTHQHAVLLAASYPSIPRIDCMMAAWHEELAARADAKAQQSAAVAVPACSRS